MKVLKYIFQNVQHFSNIPEYGNDTLFQLSLISLPSRRAALGSLREQKRPHQQQQPGIISAENISFQSERDYDVRLWNVRINY